jgi:hypothetical protein
MNELNLIRTLLSEAPPSTEVIAEGRRRIAGQSTRRGRIPVRWGLTGAGLVAAAAAATAITLAATAGAPGAGPAASAPPSVPPRLHFGPATTSAGVLRNAALAALQLSAGAPKPDQFVYTKLYQYQQAVSPPGGVLQTWSSVDGTRFGVEDAGPKLKSALPACRNGHWWGKAVGEPAADDKVGCTLAVAAAYRPDMPTSPAALGAYLHKILFVDPGDSGGLLVQTEQMITTGYLTPAQHAAIYRLLAQTPGLTLVPHATNVQGQAGVGIRSGIWKDSVYTIIFDRKTYAPLGMNWTGVAGPMKGTRNGEVLLKTSIVNNTPPLP